MRICHPRPFGAQNIQLCGVCLCAFRCGTGLGGQGLRGIARGEISDQCLPGRNVGPVAQEHLVNGIPRRVKDLQAVARAIFGIARYRKAVHPVLRENAQVDIIGQHHRGMLATVIIVIATDLFVHGRCVARQRHHLAQGGQSGHQPIRASGDSCHTQTNMRRLQCGLGDTQLGGKIAFAKLWIVDAGGADQVRCGHCRRAPFKDLGGAGFRSNQTGSLAGSVTAVPFLLVDNISRI